MDPDDDVSQKGGSTHSMSQEEFEPGSWQVRFYVVCAVSTSILVGAIYCLQEGDWFGGFSTGFGIASVMALLFLAVQRWALVGAYYE